MDTSTFRWILIIAGSILIAGLLLFSSTDRKRKPRASRKRVHAARVRLEPGLAAEKADPEQVSGVDGEASRQTELAIDTLDDAEQQAGTRLEPTLTDTLKTPSGPPPDKIVTLFLQARDKQVISGVELLDASLKAGLIFGKFDIFHRIHEEDLEPVFSMANLTKPGAFDKKSWNTMEIKGVTVFMALPGPRNALDAWDSMLATCRRLGELLHADLLDDEHHTFTRQRSLQIKEELREYERQSKTAS